jgi:hypothetical protein
MNFKNRLKPTKRKIILFVGLFFIGILIFNPFKENRIPEKSPVPADVNSVKEHLTALTKTLQFRNYKNLDQLNDIAGYIHQNFNTYSDSTSYQEYIRFTENDKSD